MSFARLPRVVFSVGVAALLGSLAVSARADTTLNSGTTTVSTGTNFGTRLYVASTGTAAMNVITGGYATDSIGYLGYSAGSLGTVTVSSGTWAHSLALFVGNNGAGVLTMSDGKITCGTQGFVGTNPGSNGAATVSGGTWAMSGDLYTGNSGTGTLTVTGGSVSYRDGSVGTFEDGVGTVTVSDGSFAGTSSLTVGDRGNGTLNVSGGSVTNTVGSIGNSAGSVGTATVSSGTWATSSNLIVGVSGTGTLNLNGGLVTVGGTLSRGTAGSINLNSGGTLQIGVGSAGGVLLGGTGSLANNGALVFHRSDASTYSGIISGTGSIQNAGTGTTTLTGQTSFVGGLVATAGRLIVGSTASVNGFSTTGSLAAGSGATLELKSKGLAYVNGMSTLTGGTIRAANGISLGAGANVVGTGVISGDVSAASGSWIEADAGKLTVGNASSYVGFDSDGRLYTNANEVELLDRNMSVLGPLTQLGDGSAGGTLRAANGMLLEQGKNLVGRGTVYGNFVNQGDVYGDGSTAGEEIVFAAGSTVSGIGSFENVIFDGTYSPGNSPAITNLSGGQFSSSSSLLMELGGTQPGTQYDRVVDSGVLTLLGGALNVVLYNGFVPSFGDSFEILQYGQLSGDFGAVNYPALSGGLSWQRTTSATAMTITVVPEPSTYAMALAGLACGGYLMVRRRV